LRDRSRPIEKICGGCDLRHTKPGSQPGHLSALIVETLRLDELKEGGATFAYPDALSALQWLSIQALVTARRKDQENDYQMRRKDQAQNAETARLQARVNRG
jgi:hypothetical protein